MPETARLSPGDPAPGFTLPDADGAPVSLADFAGRRVVVYFYPAASTPGCTAQACDFRDELTAFEGAGLAVVGISPDPQAKLVRFRDAEGGDLRLRPGSPMGGAGAREDGRATEEGGS